MNRSRSSLVELAVRVGWLDWILWIFIFDNSLAQSKYPGQPAGLTLGWVWFDILLALLAVG